MISANENFTINIKNKFFSFFRQTFIFIVPKGSDTVKIINGLSFATPLVLSENQMLSFLSISTCLHLSGNLQPLICNTHCPTLFVISFLIPAGFPFLFFSDEFDFIDFGR